MYKQLRAFNQSSAGTTPGWCLANVHEGFGIPSKYPTAHEAWLHTQQHSDRNVPGGVDVPLFYDYVDSNGNEGHINVRLANGHVWSDGNIYANLDAYLNQHPRVHYVGWGESVNDVRVIEYVADPAPAPSVVGKHLHLPADSGIWHAYHENGPYSVAAGQWVTILHPATAANGYTYPILADKGNGIYVVQSPRWGRIALWTRGTKAQIV